MSNNDANLFPRMNNRGNNITTQLSVNSVLSPQSSIRPYVSQQLAGVALPNTNGVEDDNYLYVASIENGSILSWSFTGALG